MSKENSLSLQLLLPPTNYYRDRPPEPLSGEQLFSALKAAIGSGRLLLTYPDRPLPNYFKIEDNLGGVITGSIEEEKHQGFYVYCGSCRGFARVGPETKIGFLVTRDYLQASPDEDLLEIHELLICPVCLSQIGLTPWRHGGSAPRPSLEDFTGLD